MAPRKKNQAIKASGATSSKAAPLPDWVKSGGKPPPPSHQQQQQQPKSAAKGPANAAAGSSASTSASAVPPRPPPLFPPGTKTPQNLLNERIQKLYKDWNKPEYHPRPVKSGQSNAAEDEEEDYTQDYSKYNNFNGNGKAEDQIQQPWTCSVNLSRPNPKDRSNNLVVRLQPDERDERQRFTEGQVMSKEMARHWGATYALFRLFSHLSLALMLPPQFREYWSSLEDWKKSLPEHTQAILFASDPFVAQEQAKSAKREREAKAKANAASSSNGRPGTSGIDEERLPKRWKEAKEVRMTKSIRDWVEEIVKRHSADLPADDEEEHALEADGTPVSSAGPSTPSGSQAPAIDVKQLTSQLSQLGFRKGYVQAATSWLSRAKKASGPQRQKDALLTSIKGLPDMEAAMTYLTLYVPEEDLPDRFKASKTSTNEGFVTATQRGHSKEDALRLQWATDRLVKSAGFPRTFVDEAVLNTEAASGNDIGMREICAIRNLSQRLASSSDAAAESNARPSADALRQARASREEELTVVTSILGNERIWSIPQDERPLGFTGNHEDGFDIIVAGPSRSFLEGGDWGKEEIRLRILWKHDDYPNAQKWPSFYIASPSDSPTDPTLPGYLKLALTQDLLKGLATNPDWTQDGQVVLPMVEALEANWRDIVDGTKIRFEEVMAGFVARSRNPTKAEGSGSGSSTPKGKSATFAPAKPLRRDTAADALLAQRQQELRSSTSGQKLLAQRGTLPIAHHYADIVSILSSHRLTLLTGSTGSGKTTQLPQFILDSAIESGFGSECKIIVTQPRRVSAMSIAERVANERGEVIGETIGWAVRGERKVGKANRVLFTTTGLLLRRMQNEPDLASISHLLIDEIHERSLDSDLLLLEIATLLKLNPNIKVVLMSATIQKDKFVGYFSSRIGAGNKVGSVDVEGRIHPVDDYYLEDLVRQISYRPSASSFGYGRDTKGSGPLKGLRDDLTSQGFTEGDITALEVLERERPGSASGAMDYDLVGRAVRHVASREEAKEKSSGDDLVGGILVFMSGVGEIRQAVDSIRSAMQGSAVEILPLHSNLSNEEQQQVFKPCRAGARKVVVATNVAEASITIDGITAVIDSGRVKETSYDPESGLTRLIEQFTSKASAMQRRGRAGRTRKGECWKLFSRTYERNKMQEESQPEMTRVPLESVILHVLSMGKNDVKAYLSSALDPPSLASISSAIGTLYETGAIRQLGGKGIATTALGRHLANLPLDLRLGKLLILGCTFKCLGPLLTLAALMSCKPLFSAPFERREELSAVRSKKAEELNLKSDLLTDAAIYDEWSNIRKKGGSNADMKRYAQEHLLNFSTLRDVSSTRLDLLSNLQDLGFVPRHYNRGNGNTTNDVDPLDLHSSDSSLLRGLLTASLWPNMIRISHPETKYNQSSSGAVARESEAKQVKFFDNNSSTSTDGNGRVFLHPSSILFSANKFDSSHLVYFQKASSGASRKDVAEKIYLRDATETPVYSLLLLCGKLRIHHLKGGISISSNNVSEAKEEEEGFVRLRAPARIGVLSSQLRRLLDFHLARAFERDSNDEQGEDGEELLEVMRILLQKDGMGSGTLK
ncbi:unnamed protein product [Sympodiomycopsis kandeliae]